MKHARLIDPSTDRPIARLRAGGTNEKRQPSTAKVEHLRYDWFPLRVTPGRERLARLLLEDRGIVTFVPTEAKWRNRTKQDRARRQKQLIEYPWHPGLLFVGITRPYPWHDVFCWDVVRSIISPTPTSPCRLKHEEVWRLMQRFGRGRFVRPEHQRWMRSGEEFAVNDPVVVIDGALEGRRFIVSGITGELASVFGEFFGTARCFDIPVEHLAKDE